MKKQLFAILSVFFILMAGFGVGIAAAEDSTGDNSASDSSNDNSASDSSTSDSASDSSGDNSVSDDSADDSNSDSSGDSSVDDSTDDSADDTPEDNSVSDDSASDASTSDDSVDDSTKDNSVSDDSTEGPAAEPGAITVAIDDPIYENSDDDFYYSSDDDYNISSDDDETYTYSNNMTSEYSDDDTITAGNNSTVHFGDTYESNEDTVINDNSTTNITNIETTNVTIDKSTNVHYNVVNDNSVVNNIYFTPTKSSGTAKIVVEDLKDECLKVKPAGNIYQSFNIWIDNKDVANNMENAAVDFKVEKSWLTSNGLDKSAIVLNMYDNGKWIEVPITITSEDSKYIYFKAEVSRYSTFAITSKTVVVDTSLEQSNTKISEEPIDEPTKNVIIKLLELIIDLLE